ncbi:CMD domain-containing protein [Siccibacter colletis]|uniref:CMD domain-containing protein n=1 Tax=Siccibacter colletis TaxID=1505757 RepID=UPI0028BD341E|nr:CMD domain-containing protein [Siccibacter colletis]WNN46906.1 CMD domain-containing protein [Siccibacter colletis]
MEQRRFSGKSHWYHETQARTCQADVQPLVPEAARVNDRFLLDLVVPDACLRTHRAWLDAARAASIHLLPDTLETSRLVTLSCYDRLSTALTVAQVFGVQRLCNHYAARLAPLPGPDSSRESNQRLAQITQYARQLASSPTLIDARCRSQLSDVGLTESDRVTFNHIIGFVGFQARVVAVLQAINGQPARWLPGIDSQQDAPGERFAAPEADWQADIPLPQAGYLRPAQREVLAQVRRVPVLEPIADGLIEDENALLLLATLVETLFSGQHAPLLGLVSARINGSSHCFHRLSREVSDSALPDAVRNGERALLAWSHNHPEERALVQAAQVLTRSPDRFSAAQFTPVLEAGFSRDDALRLLSLTALCGWLNRLKIGLGDALPGQTATGPA